MKWLLLQDEFAQSRRFPHHNEKGFEDVDQARGIVRLKKRKRLIDDSFIIYKTKGHLDAALLNKDEFHLWVRYPLPTNEDIKLGKKVLERQKINYECFCGGYLKFYERTISFGNDIRTLYLEWTDDYVNIHISTPPVGQGYKFYVTEFIKKGYSFIDYGDGENFTPPSNSDVDPPPPPQPPPPPDA